MKHLPPPKGPGCSVYETPPLAKRPGCSVCETPPSARILWRNKIGRIFCRHKIRVFHSRAEPPPFSQTPAGSPPSPAPALQSNSISSWIVVETGAGRRVSRLAASPLGVIPPSPKGPRSYARKALLLCAGQFGNPDCPVYGTIPPAGEPRTVPYVGQSPLPKGRTVPCGGTISIVEKPGRSAVRTTPNFLLTKIHPVFCRQEIRACCHRKSTPSGCIWIGVTQLDASEHVPGVSGMRQGG